MRTSLALTLVLVVVAAGCGGTKSPTVADVTGNGDTTTSSSDAAPPPGGSTSSGSGGGASLTMKLANGAKFSQCMRAHGVPNFPDPGHDGSIQFGPGSGIDPNSPKFKAAQEACQKLLPHGAAPSPEDQQKMQAAALSFSRCMRAHGLPDFPDPQFSAGKVSLGIHAKAGSGLDPNSPTFRRAQQACQGRLGKLGKPTSSSAK